MKKLLAIALIASATTLVACGNQKAPEAPAAETKTESVVQETVSEAPAANTITWHGITFMDPGSDPIMDETNEFGSMVTYSNVSITEADMTDMFKALGNNATAEDYIDMLLTTQSDLEKVTVNGATGTKQKTPAGLAYVLYQDNKGYTFASTDSDYLETFIETVEFK